MPNVTSSCGVVTGRRRTTSCLFGLVSLREAWAAIKGPVGSMLKQCLISGPICLSAMLLMTINAVPFGVQCVRH